MLKQAPDRLFATIPGANSHFSLRKFLHARTLVNDDRAEVVDQIAVVDRLRYARISGLPREQVRIMTYTEGGLCVEESDDQLIDTIIIIGETNQRDLKHDAKSPATKLREKTHLIRDPRFGSKTKKRDDLSSLDTDEVRILGMRFLAPDAINPRRGTLK